jgi:hypothetical protein
VVTTTQDTPLRIEVYSRLVGSWVEAPFDSICKGDRFRYISGPEFVNKTAILVANMDAIEQPGQVGMYMVNASEELS